jgi:hypothetical protein
MKRQKPGQGSPLQNVWTQYVKSPLCRCLLLALFLSGCQNAMFTPAITPDMESAVVHLYRPKASTPGLAKPLVFAYPEVLIDNTSVGVVKYNEYISFRVTPGKHNIRITGLTAGARAWELRDIKQTIRAEAGQTLYMRLRVDFNVSEMAPLTSPKPSYIYVLTPMSEENAAYEIRHTSPGK